MLTTKDLMLENPISVEPDTTVKLARQLMESEGIMQLPVLQQGRLVGIITDRDLCMAVHSPVGSYKSVGDYMTADPVTVKPGTPAYRTAHMLSTYKYGALPVVEGEKLVGIITASRLLSYFASKWNK